MMDLTSTNVVLLLFIGILGIIWYIFWLLLIFDSPAKHPRISEREKEHIESGIADANVGSEKVLENALSFLLSLSFSTWRPLIPPYTGSSAKIHQKSLGENSPFL